SRSPDPRSLFPRTRSSISPRTPNFLLCRATRSASFRGIFPGIGLGKSRMYEGSSGGISVRRKHPANAVAEHDDEQEQIARKGRRPRRPRIPNVALASLLARRTAQSSRSFIGPANDPHGARFA